MSAASSLVSIETLTLLSDSVSPSVAAIGRAHFDLSKPGGGGAVSRAHNLLGLSFAAIRSAPQSPLIARTNRIHAIPELGRDAGIRRIFQHAPALAMLDLPSNFAS